MSSLFRPQTSPEEEAALDAYSAIVTRVAERLLPSVASLRIGAPGRRFAGVGSAVALTPDLLVTSAHVVGRAVRAVAAFPDGSEHEVELAGVDPPSDLALVHVPGGGLSPVQAGDADRLRVGQLVVAVGSPLGYAGSVTAGVVSGLGRSLSTGGERGRVVIEDVIQTDAALNPGNSGGALADGAARLVGINTAVAGVGLGLAVPINATTRRILDALRREGRVRRGYLGIAGGTQPLPPAAAARLGRGRAVGIVEVAPGSPAERAGLRPGDLIVGIGARPVSRTGDLQAQMVGTSAGQPIEVEVLREGRLLRLTVVPATLG
jgi:S1-C subfamily serine protease